MRTKMTFARQLLSLLRDETCIGADTNLPPPPNRVNVINFMQRKHKNNYCEQ
jgi:hypothetical protein